jgi:hypothetical protein
MKITLTRATPSTARPADASPRTARSRWTRRAAAAAIVATGIAASGVAFAAWTVAGAGAGSAGAAEASDLASVTFAIGDDLYPGLLADGKLTVTNPNPFPVKITAVTFQNPVSDPTACTVAIGGTATDVRFINLTSQGFVLAASSGAVEITLPGIVQMDEEASNDCQSATFTADVVLTAASTTDAVNTGD